MLKQLLDVIHLANVYTNQMRAKNEPPKAFILHKIAKYIAHILGALFLSFLLKNWPVVLTASAGEQV